MSVALRAKDDATRATTPAATLVTVLRSGGRYDVSWVERLADGAARFAPGFGRIVCLTDVETPMAGVETVALRHDWPGWWSKMEAFRPGLFQGLVCLCDLDTVLAGDASALATPGVVPSGVVAAGPTAMEDHFHKGRLSSALLRWHGDELAFVYETFAEDPERWMMPGSCGPVPNAVHGDQVVIDHLLRRRGLAPAFLQDVHPGLIDFYGADKTAFGPIVVFIGDAKPDLAGEPIRSLWNRRAAAPDA